MEKFFPAKQINGYQLVTPVGEATKLTGLALLNLQAQESYQGELALDNEGALVILSGTAEISVDGQNFGVLGGRKDVFSGCAASVYLPVGAKYTVKAQSALAIAIPLVKAEKKFPAFVVSPEEVEVNHRGLLNWQRDVHNILEAKVEGRVDKIILGETFTYPGHWSSYPSHKHDVYNPPIESKLDEIYFFQVKPDAGFGVQVLYNDDLSLRECYMLKNGDSIAIREGYHPVVAAPGFQVYYLWVMAGDYGRKLTPHDDPNLTWINNVAPMLKAK